MWKRDLKIIPTMAVLGSLSPRKPISRADFEKALKPEFWPVGWSVRQYFHAKKKPENTHQDSASANNRPFGSAQ